MNSQAGTSPIGAGGAIWTVGLPDQGVNVTNERRDCDGHYGVRQHSKIVRGEARLEIFTESAGGSQSLIPPGQIGSGGIEGRSLNSPRKTAKTYGVAMDEEWAECYEALGGTHEDLRKPRFARGAKRAKPMEDPNN
jgi:hypothetical protein